MVLDAEAITALLESGHPARRRVRRIIKAARPTARVAPPPPDCHHGRAGPGHRPQPRAGRPAGSIRQLGLLLRDTERGLARLVGSVLAQAGAGSEAHGRGPPVAVAVEDGGGVIVTGDPHDLERLASPYRTIVGEGLTGP